MQVSARYAAGHTESPGCLEGVCYPPPGGSTGRGRPQSLPAGEGEVEVLGMKGERKDERVGCER